MYRITRIAAAAFVALAGMVAVNANATTVYDTPLASPPGVFFGSGNANSNFTAVDVNNLELGLSAITRFVGPIDPGAGSNVYNVPTGDTTVSGKTGSNWGVTFSINTQNGGGTQTLGNYTYVWQLTDVVQGTTGSFNPLLIPDNSYVGSPAYTAQNSEALSFPGIALGFNDPAFTDAINDTFIFDLKAYSGDQVLVADDQIIVQQGAGAPVPEPGSFTLLGAGLLGLGFMGWRGRGRSQQFAGLRLAG